MASPVAARLSTPIQACICLVSSSTVRAKDHLKAVCVPWLLAKKVTVGENWIRLGPLEAPSDLLGPGHRRKRDCASRYNMVGAVYEPRRRHPFIVNSQTRSYGIIHLPSTPHVGTTGG